MNRLFPVVVGFLMVVGCSGGSVATTVPSSDDSTAEQSATTSEETTTLPTPTSTTVAETTTTGPVEPVVRGPTAYVLGREECEIYQMEVPLSESTSGPEIEHGRDGEFVCTVTNNDPRVAGTARYTLNQDRWGTGAANGTLVQWGTVHLENDNGAWDADYFGIYTSETGDVGTTLFTGSGEYEGLSYYKWSISYGENWNTQGVIFPTITDP